MTVQIAAHGLHRSHPGSSPWAPRRPVLRDVDLQVAGGSRVGLVGSSGSGKTTLLRCLLALDPTDQGEVTCDGRAVAPGPVRSLRWFRRLVQYVPQDPASSLNPRMTVAELVAEPLRRLEVPGHHPTLVAQGPGSRGQPSPWCHWPARSSCSSCQPCWNARRPRSGGSPSPSSGRNDTHHY